MISLVFDESVTNGPTDGPTDQRTDRPAYRDARTHLKISLEQIQCYIWMKYYLLLLFTPKKTERFERKLIYCG